MVFCNTSKCDADQCFLRTDGNRARTFITTAVQHWAVVPMDPSIVYVHANLCITFKNNLYFFVYSCDDGRMCMNRFVFAFLLNYFSLDFPEFSCVITGVS